MIVPYRLLAPLFLLITGFTYSGYAQKDLHYELEVKTDLAKAIFNISGKLSFSVLPHTGDSIEMVISKGNTVPVIRLLNSSLQIRSKDTTVNEVGDIAYHIKFTQALSPGSKLEFEFSYKRGAARSFQFYLDSSFCMAGGYGTAWYPKIISPTKSGGRQYTKATANIRVTTATALTAVMAGTTVKVAEDKGLKTFAFTCLQPDIFSLYIGDYSMKYSKGILPFYTYTLAGTTCQPGLSEKSAAVLDFLTTQFGPLEIPSFSIIELPEYVSELTSIGGASLLGGILMPTSALRNFNYALFGHELGHQWWGNLVIAEEGEGNALLSEGMAQYGSLQVVNHFDKDNALYYRTRGYPGYIADQSGLGYLKFAAAGIDEPLTRLTGINDHLIADSKGFLVLDLLSETIGKTAFNKALQHITAAYRESGLSWIAFKTEMNKAAGSNLDWFFRQWFERTGAPGWQTQWTQEQQDLVLTITQKDSLYTLAPEIKITYVNGSFEWKKISFGDRSTTIRLPVKAKVASVEVDPSFRVLHWEDKMKEEAIALSTVTQLEKLRLEQKNDEAEQLAVAALDQQRDTDPYAVEFSLLCYIGRIKVGKQHIDEALDYYKRALLCASRNAAILPFVYYRIAWIAAGKKDKTLFDWARVQAFKADIPNGGRNNMASMMSMLEKKYSK